MHPMAAISSDLLIDAARCVERMSLAERVQLADEVRATQPNLFFSVLALQEYSATLEQLEVVLNILLILFEAVKLSGKTWGIVTEAIQERCLARVAGRMRFIEGLTPQQQTIATEAAVAEHPEKQLLAYVVGKFQEHGLLDIKTETEKMMMLASLNLVECIGQTAPE
jgi:hypothetical protein